MWKQTFCPIELSTHLSIFTKVSSHIPIFDSLSITLPSVKHFYEHGKHKIHTYHVSIDFRSGWRQWP